jgi:hypothetical protein
MAIGRDAWQVAFQLSPILLQGGLIPSFVPAVPILAATAALGLVSTAVGGALPTSVDDSFAQFQPMSGGTVLDQQIATYPFANLSIAANSIIDQPKRVSFQMVCPARGPMGYWTKLAQMEALITALRLHNQRGGTYILLTPSYIYFDCLMRNMRDTSSGQTKQIQNIWTFDFEQPLLTLEDASNVQQTLNGILTGITNGQPPPVGAAGNPTAGA